MKYLYIFLIAILTFSCAGYRKTHFPITSIELGVTKEDFMHKFGIPFKSDVYRSENNLIEILSYKEAVDVSSYTYILTSVFTFKNSILVNMEQKEEYPDNPNINVKPTK